MSGGLENWRWKQPMKASTRAHDQILQAMVDAMAPHQATTVFTSSMVTVIGPTPPGTGDSAEAMGSTSSARTSPQRPLPACGMPDIDHSSPGADVLGTDHPEAPAATTGSSASRVWAARSAVQRWTMVTVVRAAWSIEAMG